MLKRMVIMLVAVGAVLGGVFGFQAFKASMIRQAQAALSNPPQTVSTITANSQEWSSRLETVGSLRGVDGANLSSQVAGIVSALHFESGADVKPGTLLIELLSADDIAHRARPSTPRRPRHSRRRARDPDTHCRFTSTVRPGSPGMTRTCSTTSAPPARWSVRGAVRAG